MSFFEYYCHNCQFEFEQERPIGTASPKKCPNCDEPYGEMFTQKWGSKDFVLGKGFIPITTAGQQSELNKKMIGKEQLSHLEDAYKQRGPEQLEKTFKETRYGKDKKVGI